MSYKKRLISIRKCIDVTNVVNDITCTCQNVITSVVLRFFMTQRYPLNNSGAI